MITREKAAVIHVLLAILLSESATIIIEVPIETHHILEGGNTLSPRKAITLMNNNNMPNNSATPATPTVPPTKDKSAADSTQHQAQKTASNDQAPKAAPAATSTPAVTPAVAPATKI